MGAIYQDGEAWRARILIGYDPATGKPVYKKMRAQSHDDAVKALKTLQATHRTHTLAAPSGLTLAQYTEEWLETRIKPSRAPKTYQQYKWVLTQHVTPTLGKKHVDAVTRRDIQNLVAALAKQPVKDRTKPKKKTEKKAEAEAAEAPPIEQPKKPEILLGRRTIALAVTVLHSVFENAIRDGKAHQNPATYINLPTSLKKPAQSLSTVQVIELNKNLEGSPVRDLVRFMLATGARLGEATGVRWEDIDIERRFVRITGQLQRIEKKLVYRPTTKTNQDRTLTISPWLAEQLSTMKARQLIDEHKDPDGIAFLNPWGRRFDPKFVYTELAAACIKAEIPPVSPHKLRHTAATLALMETGDLSGVQKMLGHQQVALTSNLYGHATAERLRPITDALGKLVNPANVKGAS
ncbi:MAG TPA: tyrosine-type recombinase/integrase [Fimbriimonadaceae bacterium]|nr:tyrosine-type recombinase/integrase [Fimbriimonadaceae bacterium]